MIPLSSMNHMPIYPDEIPIVPSDFEEHLSTVVDGFADCLDEAFLEGLDRDGCFSPSGLPLILVPANWPPRRNWRSDEFSPRRAIIYLDELVDSENGHYWKDPFVDPWEEISEICRLCRDHLLSVTVYGSYFAAHHVFKMVSGNGGRLTKSMQRFIDGINSSENRILFKFLILRSDGENRKSSAARFLYA